MPVYEYICDRCGTHVTKYFHTHSESITQCPKCSTNSLQRLVSSFSMGKTDSDVYDNILNDQKLTSGLMQNDPRALAEWNKRMSGGEKVAPEYEDMVGKMEKGEMPTEPAGKRKENQSKKIGNRCTHANLRIHLPAMSRKNQRIQTERWFSQ